MATIAQPSKSVRSALGHSALRLKADMSASKSCPLSANGGHWSRGSVSLSFRGPPAVRKITRAPGRAVRLWKSACGGAVPAAVVRSCFDAVASSPRHLHPAA
jgi:hypothetical protein